MDTNIVIQWDCLEYMKTLPDKCIDLVLTDPPYWIWADVNMIKTAWQKYWNWAAHKKYYWETNWDSWRPSKEYFDEILRISKKAIIFWWNYFSSDLPDSSCWIVRDKNNWANNFADCELAWTNFTSAVRMYKWTRNGMLQEDMWNKEHREHPTQKPVPLFKRILENYSKEWDIIFDCFAWSWTTWVACKEMWRQYILVEKEPKYIEIINRRLSTVTKSLFI